MRLSANEIRDIARTNTTPISIPRSVRQINQIVATSMPAGKMVPVTAFPLLREDQLRNSMIHCKVDLMETAEIIKNGIKCRFMAYFVPFLAFERFNGGMDEFNRSYMGQNIADGATVTPFFTSAAAPPVGGWAIHKYLGLHSAPGELINTAYLEAYNAIWNFRARNRSETLFQAKKRYRGDNTLAPAFWQHEQFKYVVPDWDDVAMEGAVDLSFTTSKAWVNGVGFESTNPVLASVAAKTAGGSGAVTTANRALSDNAAGRRVAVAPLAPVQGVVPVSNRQRFRARERQLPPHKQ